MRQAGGREGNRTGGGGFIDCNFKPMYTHTIKARGERQLVVHSEHSEVTHDNNRNHKHVRTRGGGGGKLVETSMFLRCLDGFRDPPMSVHAVSKSHSCIAKTVTADRSTADRPMQYSK